LVALSRIEPGEAEFELGESWEQIRKNILQSMVSRPAMGLGGAAARRVLPVPQSASFPNPGVTAENA
jgi:hypothetical protein